MSDFIYDFVIITIIGGVIVGLILIALQKTNHYLIYNFIKVLTVFFKSCYIFYSTCDPKKGINGLTFFFMVS